MIKIKGLSKNERTSILIRDNYTCQKCKLVDKTSKQLEIHHIKPIVFGGTDNKENLITLCGVCHKYASNTTNEFKEYLKSECDGQMTLLSNTLKKINESEEGKKLIKQINNKRKIIICKICNEEKELHAKDSCFQCYRKHLWERKNITCKNCGKQRSHKAFGLCASCHVKLHHYDKIKSFNCKRWHNISINLYRKITKKCLICGFDKIVDLHHLDRNHDNNIEENLVGLCPNHHKMLHNSKYSTEVKQTINDILSKKKLKKVKSPLDNL